MIQHVENDESNLIRIEDDTTLWFKRTILRDLMPNTNETGENQNASSIVLPNSEDTIPLANF